MGSVDAIKAIASQFIVLHHLALYGPLSDTLYGVAPAPLDWLVQYARIAVQCFLVIAGFLAARALAPAGVPAVAADPIGLLAKRYRRLVPPYLVAIALSIFAAAVARAWIADETIPTAAALPQILAHALLVQDLLGYEGLSAGVWYVAIDFHLFVLFVVLLRLAQRIGPADRRGPRMMLFVAALAAASLLYFNLDEDLDVWAFYFFGAYALGAFAWWAGGAERPRLATLALLVAGAGALAFDFRLRILVALATALVLASSRWTTTRWRLPAGVAFLANISFALFLVHYPIALVFNTVFDRLAPGDPAVALVGTLGAWLASIAAAALFHRHVECRLLDGAVTVPRPTALPVRSA